MIWNYRCMVFRNQSVGKKNDVRRPFSWRHFCEFRCPVMPSNGNSVLVVSWFHYTTWVWKWCLSQKKTIFIGKMRINQGLGLTHFQTKPHWQIKTPNHCLWMFSPRKNSHMCNLRPMPMQNILHKCTAIATKQVSAYLWLFRFLCCGCLNHWQAPTTDRRQLRVSNCNSCHHTSQATQIANKKFTHGETTMRNIGQKLTTKHRRKLTTTYPNVYIK